MSKNSRRKQPHFPGMVFSAPQQFMVFDSQTSRKLIGMGGGDLNLKKSWHPSTMKNQERVWKVEQQKAMEDKKIAEKKREIEQERMHEDLKRTAEGSGAIKPRKEKLDWMYQGIRGNVDREEYLLGRKIDKTLELINTQEKAEENPEPSKPAYVIEHEVAPESVVRREGDDFQVDLKRKISEDPLFYIRQQEEQVKKKITSNPVKMQTIQLLVKSLESKKDKKSKKKKHKKEKDSSEKKSKKKSKKRKRDSSTSSSSSSSSSSEEEVERKRHKAVLKSFFDKKQQTSKKKSRRDSSSSSSSSSSDEEIRRKRHKKIASRDNFKEERQQTRNKSPDRSHRNKPPSQKHDRKHRQQYSPERRDRDSSNRRSDRGERIVSPQRRESYKHSSDRRDRRDRRSPDRKDRSNYSRVSPDRSRDHRDDSRKRPARRTSEEMERLREEMKLAAKLQEASRLQRIDKYRMEEDKEKRLENSTEDFVRNLGGQSISMSVEDRIKSKAGFSQKGTTHMNKNFVRK